MSPWYSEEDTYLPFTWPDSIRKGFEIIYGQYIPLKEIEAFLARWRRGIANETFIRILSEGQGQDRVIAITALGSSGFPQIWEFILPFLQSADPHERWAAALVLGALHMDEALPILITMLTEYFPTWQYTQQLNNPGWFENNRFCIPTILDSWEDTSLVVPLRHALLTSVEIEKQTRLQSMGFYRQLLLLYQDNLMRSLGRRGTLGALAGLTLAQIDFEIAVVHIVAGYCRIEEDPELLGYPWNRDQQVYKVMIRVMKQYFGLSLEERINYLNNYPRNLSVRRNLRMKE